MQAFFDDEGHVAKKGFRIELTSINNKGLLQIQKMLNDLNIETRMGSPYQPKNPKHHTSYTIRINKLSTIKFAELIGSNHSKKKERFKQILSK